MARATAVVLMLLSGGLSALYLAGLSAAGQSAVAEYAHSPYRQVGPSSCTITGTKRAGPSPVLLGETINVTMTARVSCDEPLRIALVLDASGSMAGDRNTALKAAARHLVARLDPRGFADIELGVVQFNTNARTLCELTDDERRLIACIEKISAYGGTNVAEGVREGLRVLDRAEPNTRRVMILVTDAEAEPHACARVIGAARTARDLGVTMFAVCMGADCDGQCMLQAATSPAYFYHVAQPTAQLAVFEELARRVISARIVPELTIIDPLGADVLLVADSPGPSVTRDRSTDRRLVWQFENPVLDRVTVTLSVTPTRTGLVATNAGARVFITDHAGLTTTLSLPDPHVLVLEPGAPTPHATASPTPTVPTPTLSPTPTPRISPTYTPSPIPTSTPDARPYQIMLPLAMRDAPLSHYLQR